MCFFQHDIQGFPTVPGLISNASFFQSWVEAKLRKHGVLFEHVRMGPASLRRTRVAVRAGQYRVLYFSSRRVLHAGPD
eukprot:SAG11_NODE_4752_length_1779_cov_37.624405_1_plen_77_part_10